MILKIENLKVSYGAIEAIKNISLEVKQGEIVALIGPNGAGKTTLLRTISGLLKPVSGSIKYFSDDGSEIDLSGLPPHEIVKRGIAQVPEGRMIFANLTVRENLELGAFSRKTKSIAADEFDRIFHLFPRIKERLNQSAGTLSGGEQQMLAISRALMAKPRLLLLDEPSLGIAPNLIQQIFKVLVDINQSGTTLLLVEQDAVLALKTASRAYVVQTGEVVLADTASVLLKDPRIKESYLG